MGDGGVESAGVTRGYSSPGVRGAGSACRWRRSASPVPRCQPRSRPSRMTTTSRSLSNAARVLMPDQKAGGDRGASRHPHDAIIVATPLRPSPQGIPNRTPLARPAARLMCRARGRCEVADAGPSRSCRPHADDQHGDAQSVLPAAAARCPAAARNPPAYANTAPQVNTTTSARYQASAVASPPAANNAAAVGVRMAVDRTVISRAAPAARRDRVTNCGASARQHAEHEDGESHPGCPSSTIRAGVGRRDNRCPHQESDRRHRAAAADHHEHRISTTATPPAFPPGWPHRVQPTNGRLTETPSRQPRVTSSDASYSPKARSPGVRRPRLRRHEQQPRQHNAPNARTATRTNQCASSPWMPRRHDGSRLLQAGAAR